MSTVEVAIEDPGVAVLTLRGNHAFNLFDNDMRDGLIDAAELVRRHPDVRSVVLRSAGEHFCAGADLRQFGEVSDVFEARRIRARRDPWAAMWELPQPMVAAIRGFALGSGFEMSLLCDLRVAHPAAQLGLPEVRLGMLPGACGTQSLPRAIGSAAALPPILMATTLGASEALELGAVDLVDEDPEAAALCLATELARRPRPALRAARSALRWAADEPLPTGLTLERTAATALARDR